MLAARHLNLPAATLEQAAERREAAVATRECARRRPPRKIAPPAARRHGLGRLLPRHTSTTRPRHVLELDLHMARSLPQQRLVLLRRQRTGGRREERVRGEEALVDGGLMGAGRGR